VGLLGGNISAVYPVGSPPGMVPAAAWRGGAEPNAGPRAESRAAARAAAVAAPQASAPAPMVPWRDTVTAQPLEVAGSAGYDAMLADLDVSVADLFDLKIQTIVIDPGHGGNDSGAIGPQGIKEKDITLDIARRLQEKLAAGSRHRVLLTREEDRWMYLKDRVQFAKDNHADLFISIHINSVPQEAGQVNYVETYYFGPHTDQRSLDLARAENHDSDYAIGDFREIIAKIGDTLKTEESAQLATAVHRQLYGNLKTHNADLLDAGAKTGPFVVLLGVEVPSILVEISCISNAAEEVRLGTPEYRDSVASYLETGIVEYLRQRSVRNSVPKKENGVNKHYVAQQEG
jgi:N-acetylmuramoyl-L-alanine amidase